MGKYIWYGTWDRLLRRNTTCAQDAIKISRPAWHTLLRGHGITGGVRTTVGIGTSRAGNGVDKRLVISGWLGGWFGDFEKNAVSVFRVNEVDACSAGADFGFGVQQAGSLCAQVLAQCVNVVGAHAHLL